MLSVLAQITAFDTQAIAKQCRTIGPFARAALNEEEMQLLKNMMRRVEILADIAAQVLLCALLLVSSGLYLPTYQCKAISLHLLHLEGEEQDSAASVDLKVSLASALR